MSDSTPYSFRRICPRRRGKSEAREKGERGGSSAGGGSTDSAELPVQAEEKKTTSAKINERSGSLVDSPYLFSGGFEPSGRKKKPVFAKLMDEGTFRQICLGPFFDGLDHPCEKKQFLRKKRTGHHLGRFGDGKLGSKKKRFRKKRTNW